jgi:NNP family nitrate/nitrite transporter-like MFS transporter
MRAGHLPTLTSAFVYFAFSCCIWVLNGAMAPFISEAYDLTPAQKGLMLYGWQTVYAIAAAAMALPMAAIALFAKEPPDVDSRARLRDHVACLFEKDGWAFSLIYGVTFGGFIGLTTFLPTYYHDQFGVSKVQAGQLTMLAAFMGAAVRVMGGWVSDRWGGVNTLTFVLMLVALTLGLAGLAQGSLALTTLLLIVCFAALGAGNGALFQLVPLRWPTTTAVAGSMIGEIGALGGGLVPNAMGLSKQYLGSYLWGFVAFGALALAMLAVMRVMQSRWIQTWAGRGGRARPWRSAVAAEQALARSMR